MATLYWDPPPPLLLWYVSIISVAMCSKYISNLYLQSKKSEVGFWYCVAVLASNYYQVPGDHVADGCVCVCVGVCVKFDRE